MTDEIFDVCIERIKNGDKEGLHDIYKEYLPYIFSVIMTVLGNRENAEDVTSDFFIKLWNNADKYVPGSGHKRYLATIARNMSIDFLRAHKKEQLIEDFERSYDEEDNQTGLSNEQLGNISRDNSEKSPEETVVADMSIEQALGSLKESEREVVNLKVMSDMTFAEIAETVNRPMGTVTWLYRQAIEKLRRCGYE